VAFFVGIAISPLKSWYGLLGLFMLSFIFLLIRLTGQPAFAQKVSVFKTHMQEKNAKFYEILIEKNAVGASRSKKTGRADPVFSL
jgi:hypothetical protein